MLCEQCLGTLLGPGKALPRSCHPLGLEKAPREREDKPSLQEFGEVVRTQSPSPVELPGFQSEGDTKTVWSWGTPGSLVQRKLGWVDPSFVAYTLFWRKGSKLAAGGSCRPTRTVFGTRSQIPTLHSLSTSKGNTGRLFSYPKNVVRTLPEKLTT